MEKYNLGGAVTENEAFEAFAEIPQNRVLMAEKLTNNPATRPEVVHDLTTVEDVFEHFKPTVDMEFETEEGTMSKETLHFKNLGDFGIKGITGQSSFLNDLTAKKEQYQKIIKQLKTNKVLRQALSEEGSKQNVIDALNAMIMELEQPKQ